MDLSINPRQAEIIKLLSNEHLTVQELADKLGVTYHTTVRLTSQMFKAGLVERTSFKGDSGYKYSLPGQDDSGRPMPKAMISFKGTNMTFLDLIGYFSASKDKGNYEAHTYQTLVGLAVGHLYWRALMAKQGERTPAPVGYEIKHLLRSVRQHYTQTAELIDRLLMLPLYDDSELTLNLIGRMPHDLARTLSQTINQLWESEIINHYGIQDTTMRWSKQITEILLEDYKPE